MAESLILFPLDMLENVAVTVGVDGSKSVIKLKEIMNQQRFWDFIYRFDFIICMFYFVILESTSKSCNYLKRKTMIDTKLIFAVNARNCYIFG